MQRSVNRLQRKVSGECPISSKRSVQSFEWTTERSSSVNSFSLNCSWTILLSGEITSTLTVGLEAESRLCQAKHLINANLFKAMQFAESQEHQFRSAIPTFDLGRFQNILATRHTYLECRQRVVNAPNISQSYFLRCECDV